MTPPPHLGATFDATHTHYLKSGSDVIDSGELEALVNTVVEHGYGVDSRQPPDCLHEPRRGRGSE